MKKIFLLLTVLFAVNSFSQEIKYKEYSYAELFKMIENEKDTIFKLSDAIIEYDKNTDSLFIEKWDLDYTVNYPKVKYQQKGKITVNKYLEFNNVQFSFFTTFPNENNSFGYDSYFTGFINIEFLKPVYLRNTLSVFIGNSVFNDAFILGNDEELLKIYAFLEESSRNKTFDIDYGSMIIDNSTFNAELTVNHLNSRKDFESSLSLDFNNNKITGSNKNALWLYSLESVSIRNNTFQNSEHDWISVDNSSRYYLENNNFKNPIDLTVNMNSNKGELKIINNNFSIPFKSNFQNFSPNTKIDWPQLEEKMMSIDGYTNSNRRDSIFAFDKKGLVAKTRQNYFNNKQYKYKDSYLEELKLKYKFNNFYNSIYDLESANLVYISIKDFETKRAGYLYENNPNFETFFKWRINQFLKVFSAYGTKPEKAVVFSLWVILFFAFIYLLFPNSWDSHGRKRIMNRYAFFFTYMNKKSGIHEVYLDNQKGDLLEFEEFKTLIEKQGKTVPTFFTVTALPLYKWAISGTKFSASILKRVDIMKGTWSDLPKSKRIWKSILLIGAFTIAVLYDIFIKMLNALMLSINTFTTLGFGEIPIKGLPRYLAIIQGFIGWFMLTIFSVSLISQLLN